MWSLTLYHGLHCRFKKDSKPRDVKQIFPAPVWQCDWTLMRPKELLHVAEPSG